MWTRSGKERCEGEGCVASGVDEELDNQTGTLFNVFDVIVGSKTREIGQD